MMVADIIAAFCLAAGCTLPVTHEIQFAHRMPRGLLAMTEVVMVGGQRTARITFTPQGALRRDVIAHEVCHVALDHDVIGPYGYENLSDREVSRREAAVRGCGKRLAGRR